VAICLWPLAWAVCDLLTQALINIAVNPTNNSGLQAFVTGAMLLGYWILLAIWVIGSALLGPWIITRSLMAGSSAITAVLAGTVGAAVASAPRLATSVAGGAGVAGAAASAPISIASSSRMNGAYQNFATRPTSTPQPTERT
jgi:hypothetical protein